MARKRRRSEAFVADPIAEGEAIVVDVAPTGADTASVIQDGLANPVDEAQLEKAGEIWNALKEEYYETVEQLPLSLQRSYDLMRELESHVQSFNAELLTTMHAYVQLRKSLATKTAPQVDGLAKADSEGAEGDFLPQLGQTSPSAMSGEHPSPTELSNHPSTSPKLVSQPPPPFSPAQQPLSSPARQLPPSPQLSLPNAPPETPGIRRTGAPTLHLKPSAMYAFSPARFAPGTPGAVPLPEDRKKAPTLPHELLSHIAWLSEEAVRAAEEKVNLANAAYDTTDRHIRLLDQAIKEQETALTIGLRPGTHPTSIVLPELVIPPTRGQRRQLASAPHVAAAAAVVPQTPAPEKHSGLKITLPPPAAANEERYCFCNGVSFGAMVACDSGFCTREWFHYGCVGLVDDPVGQWFCSECLESKSRRSSRRRR